MLGLLDPGDEVVIFEPFYENYGPDAILSGAVPRYVTLHEPDWSIDPDELRAAFGPRTRGIVVNSPHNPTGKVFTPRRARVDRRPVHRVRRHRVHRRDLRAHRVRAASTSRSRRCPGWRTGRSRSTRCRRPTRSPAGGSAGSIASPDLSVGIRRVHDFLTVGAAAPLQAAAVDRARLAGLYYAELVAGYRERRDVLVPALRCAGFRVHEPAGRLLRHDRHPRPRPTRTTSTFARRLIGDPGVAAVPGSSFFSRPELGADQAPVRVPQAARDAPGRRGAAGQDLRSRPPPAGSHLAHDLRDRPADIGRVVSKQRVRIQGSARRSRRSAACRAPGRSPRSRPPRA